MVLLVVGLFEESVTKWMDRACCHTKWKKAKCVACFPPHASLVVCLVCSVHRPPLGLCRCQCVPSICVVCVAGRDVRICMLTWGGMQQSVMTS